MCRRSENYMAEYLKNYSYVEVAKYVKRFRDFPIKLRTAAQLVHFIYNFPHIYSTFCQEQK